MALGRHRLLRAEAVARARRAVPPHHQRVPPRVVAARPSVRRGRSSSSAHAGRRASTSCATCSARNGVPHAFHRADSPEGRAAPRAARAHRGADRARGRSCSTARASSTRPTQRAGRGVRREHRARRHARLRRGRSSAPARPGSRPRCTRPRRGCDTLVVEREAIGGQAGTQLADPQLPRLLAGRQRRRARAARPTSRRGCSARGFLLMREVAALRPRTARSRRHARATATEVTARAVVLATGVDVQAARRARASRSWRRGRVLRVVRRRGAGLRRRARLRRGRRQLGGAGGDAPRRATRRAVTHLGARRRHWPRPMSRVLRDEIDGDRRRRRAVPHRGRRRRRATGGSSTSMLRDRDGGTDADGRRRRRCSC